MTLKMKLASLITLFLFVGASSMAFGGTLTGELKFKKRAPKVALIYFPQDNGLKQDAVVDQMNTAFTSLIAVGSEGAEAVFNNSDTINHNIYANDKETKVNFDIGLASPGSVFKQKITWGDGKMVKISCKIHPKMRAWVASLSSQYFTVVQFKKKQKKAQFEIPNLPDSVSQVRIWMPGYPVMDLEIGSGKTVSETLTRKKKKRGTLTLKRS